MDVMKPVLFLRLLLTAGQADGNAPPATQIQDAPVLLDRIKNLIQWFLGGFDHHNAPLTIKCPITAGGCHRRFLFDVAPAAKLGPGRLSIEADLAMAAHVKEVVGAS
jgi:hypothetical protein